MAIPEDLDQLETSIRQLQIEWEKFFAGIERKPPTELKGRVEAVVRRYSNAEIRNNGDRFRFQSLASRYSTFAELWAKRLRAIEEGRPALLHGTRVPPPPPPPPAPAAAAAARAAANEYRVQHPDQDAAAVRDLYQQFVEARRGTGETGAVKFESFQKLITQQTSRILTEKGARAVDFRLETKDGKVSLKARPVKS
ncbi:MAG TPA: MXAN_5187 C-terminal domain-containing protein [Vicinamibacteria bacterium]|nr:MXAN_5187 C-terminal domain-containing protein [Vicinamibacteria bacterium]